MKKEDDVLEIFFNEPTKHWHFEDIIKEANISRPQAAQWLKKFLQEKIIKKVRPSKKMPYYVGDCDHSAYQIKKRLFALQFLEKKGFLQHLAGLPLAKTVILFGSMNRWDWYSESDIDLFIYGESNGFEQYKYRSKLHREIEVFVCQNKEELKNLNPSLLQNILQGYVIKGTIDFVEVKTNA